MTYDLSILNDIEREDAIAISLSLRSEVYARAAQTLMRHGRVKITFGGEVVEDWALIDGRVTRIDGTGVAGVVDCPV